MVLLLSGTVSAQERPRPGQENFLSRAVFADGRLWLLSDAGELSTIVPGKKVRVDAHLPEPALDICASDGVLRALTCARGSCTTWTLRRWAEARWTATGTIRADGDSLAAISCADTGATLVLTDRRLIEIVDGKVSSVALSEKLRTGTVTSIHVAGDRVFAGINAGEWGGGLRRVDRKTGKVLVIEKTNGALCGGPLNTACDPSMESQTSHGSRNASRWQSVSCTSLHMVASSRSVVTTSDVSTSGRLVTPVARGSQKAETNRSRPRHSLDLSVPARTLWRSESTGCIGSVLPKIPLGCHCLPLNQSEISVLASSSPTSSWCSRESTKDGRSVEMCPCLFRDDLSLG